MCEKFMNIKPNTLLAIFWLQFKLKEQKCQAALFFFVCLFLFTGKAKLSLTGVWSLSTCFKQGFSAILCFYRLMFCQVSILVFWHLLYLCWNTSTVFLVSNFSVSNFLHITYICFAFLLLLGCNIVCFELVRFGEMHLSWGRLSMKGRRGNWSRSAL